MSRLLLLSSLVGLGMSGTCNYGISFATIPAPFRDGDCQSQDLSAVGETTSMKFSCDDEMISAWNFSASCSGDPDYYLTPFSFSCDDDTGCDYIDADLGFWTGEDCSSASGIQFGTGTYSFIAGDWCLDASSVFGIGYAGIVAEEDGLTVNVYFDDECAGTVVDGDTYGNEECIVDNGTSIYAEFTYHSDAMTSTTSMVALIIGSAMALANW